MRDFHDEHKLLGESEEEEENSLLVSVLLN